MEKITLAQLKINNLLIMLEICSRLKITLQTASWPTSQPPTTPDEHLCTVTRRHFNTSECFTVPANMPALACSTCAHTYDRINMASSTDKDNTIRAYTRNIHANALLCSSLVWEAILASC